MPRSNSSVPLPNKLIGPNPLKPDFASFSPKAALIGPPPPNPLLDSPQPNQNEAPATEEERNRLATESLAKSLDKLNAHLAAVEKKLRGMMKFPLHVTVRYNERDDDQNTGAAVWELLGIIRRGGEWRLCLAHDADVALSVDWKPLIECSLEERVQASDQIDALRLEIIKSTEQYVSKVEGAVSKLSSVLAKFQ
jgi:hypothetical protein